MKSIENELYIVKQELKHLKSENAALKEKLLTQEQFIQTANNIVASLPGSIYWKDKNGVYLGCSDDMCNFLGISREKILGQTDVYIGEALGWPEETAAKAMKDDQEVIINNCPRINIEEVPFTDKNGRTINQITSKVPLLDQHGQVIGVLGFSVDITERKKMEIELKKAKEAAEIASHAKTEFLANISHDIRTPLSGIVGMAEILENEVATPTQKKHAHDLGQSGHELLNMLNEILDVVQAGELTSNDIYPAPFSIRHLIQGIINLEHPSTMVKEIELISNIDPNIPSILITDHKKLYHILLNLVGNAIKFTNVGHVEIKVSLLDQNDDKVRLKFQVIDTGKGIPPEAIEKIFERFFRVEPSYKGRDKGHGLGLHFAQSYAQLLGGTIEVSSQIDVGSSFYFTLTLQIGKMDAEVANITGNQTETGATFFPSDVSKVLVPDSIEVLDTMPQILVIEDNQIALNIVDLMLKQAKFATTPVTNGEVALELATTQHFDFIFSDVGLPGISGIEFTQQLRAFEKEHRKSPVPIIGLTAHAEGQIRDECIAAGMNDITLKPLTLSTLKTIIGKYCLQTRRINSDLMPPPRSKPGQAMGKLGADLPNTEAELLDLHTFPILNAKLAIQELGNNPELVHNMLRSFVEVQIIEEKSDLEAAYQRQDWEKIEKLAHKMKGGTVYLKLMKLSIACQYLERYRKTGRTKLLEQLYQQILSVIAETIPVIKDWLANHVKE